MMYYITHKQKRYAHTRIAIPFENEYFYREKNREKIAS